MTARRYTRKTCSDRCRKRRERRKRRGVTLSDRRRVLIELAEYPERDGFWRLMGLVAGSPGRNTVAVKLPDGAEIRFTRTTSLGSARQQAITNALGTSAIVRDRPAPEPGPDSWDAWIDALQP